MRRRFTYSLALAALAALPLTSPLHAEEAGNPTPVAGQPVIGVPGVIITPAVQAQQIAPVDQPQTEKMTPGKRVKVFNFRHKGKEGVEKGIVVQGTVVEAAAGEGAVGPLVIEATADANAPPAQPQPQAGGPVTGPATGPFFQAVPSGNVFWTQAVPAPSTATLRATTGPRYSLGVVVRKIDDAMRAQLELGEKPGMLIVEVEPDSAAAKAQVKQYDILMSVGEHPCDSADVLVSAITKCEGKELKLTLFRAGKTLEISAAPKSLPQALVLQGGLQQAPAAGAVEVQELQAAPLDEKAAAEVEALLKRLQEIRGPVRFSIAGPGVVVPPAEDIEVNTLPDGVTMKITRENDQPARVVIKQGDKTWEATESEVDTKLPEGFRKIARGLLKQLGNLAIDFDYDIVAPRPGAGVPGVPGVRVRRLQGVPFGVPAVPGGAVPAPAGGLVPPGVAPNVDERLQKMDEQMAQLLEEIRQLRQQQDAPGEK